MDKDKIFCLPIFILMASVTFMAISTELVPSGILPELMDGLDISEASSGNLVGYYAIASAIFGIPLISSTVEFSRKKLLLVLLIGFSLSNLLVGLASSYVLALIGRIVGGICAGVLWPMIAAYGMKLTDEKHKGLAVTVIMSGTTFGMSLGIPLFTYIGTRISWRAEFFGIALAIATIAVACSFMLSDVSGVKKEKSNSPLTLIKNRGVLLIMFLTAIASITNYGIYTYITNLITSINYSKGIGFAQILFGIGSILSVIIAGKVIDKNMRYLTVFMFTCSFLSFTIFSFWSNISILCNTAFFLWGIGFGALVALFQTAVSRQVPSNAAAVATSLQSATFNFTIMLTSSFSGAVLAKWSMTLLLEIMVMLLIVGIIVSFNSKKALA